METFYHGSSALFKEFDLSHCLEGDGKVKFGYGVYVTSQYRSAAHYAGANPAAKKFYVYTVEIPAIKEDNYIAFKEAVKPAIVKRAEQKLGEAIPENMTRDGKDFRKYIAKRLTGKVNLEGEKVASSFLVELGVEFIVWPYSWKNPLLGTNRVVLNNHHVKIVRIEEVELDVKKHLIEGSQKQVDILNSHNELL